MRVHRQGLAVLSRQPTDLVRQRLRQKPFSVIRHYNPVHLCDGMLQICEGLRELLRTQHRLAFAIHAYNLLIAGDHARFEKV